MQGIEISIYKRRCPICELRLSHKVTIDISWKLQSLSDVAKGQGASCQSSKRSSPFVGGSFAQKKTPSMTTAATWNHHLNWQRLDPNSYHLISALRRANYSSRHTLNEVANRVGIRGDAQPRKNNQEQSQVHPQPHIPLTWSPPLDLCFRTSWGLYRTCPKTRGSQEKTSSKGLPGALLGWKRGATMPWRNSYVSNFGKEVAHLLQIYLLYTHQE